jgi:hypothetical protein
MLSDLLEVQQRIFQSLANCGHATKRRSLELLALEQRLGVFDETNVISRDGLDKSFGGG